MNFIASSRERDRLRDQDREQKTLIEQYEHGAANAAAAAAYANYVIR